MSAAKKPEKITSTFDKIMQDPRRKKQFDKGYREFLLSEIMIELMEENHKTVRNLAKEAGLSPTVIQEIKTGKKTNITLESMSNILQSLDCSLIVKHKKQEYVLV